MSPGRTRGRLLSVSPEMRFSLAASVGSTEATAPLSAALLGLFLLNEHVATETATQTLIVIISVGAILWAVLALARAEEHLLGEGYTDLVTGPET